MSKEDLIERVKKKIKEILEREGHFSYSDAWYTKLKSEILELGLSEKEFQGVEDKAVSEFLKESRTTR